MGQMIRLQAEDGHAFDAYEALPMDVSRGAIIVVQEVFGVNAHIRDVCEAFAVAGYTALAPALFDRVRPGVELDYDTAGIEEGRALVGALGWENPILDLRAAAAALHSDSKVGIVGYCWGGTVAFLAACRLPLAAAVAYYGRQIIDFLGEAPGCPTMMHFGAEDTLIPLENVETLARAYPLFPVHVYDGAGHGFNCDRRADFRPAIADLARQRTLAFFAEHLT
jgi:carboxymethylenebutenolidase